MPERLSPLRPPARLLLGPGPSMVAPRVYEAMRQPIVGHLDPYFFEVAEDVRKLLGYVFSTRNEFNIAISGTGTSGMEAAVANFAEPGENFAVLANGYFADRISEIARRHGADVVRLEKPWGEVFDGQEARDFIRREQPRVVAYVQAETSTGAFQQGQAICEAAHEVDALAIADCVTSLGGMPVLVDETGIDIAYSCTQKGLGCPPGLAPLTVSPRAWERLRKRTAPVDSFYLDLRLLESYYPRPQVSPHRLGHHALRAARRRWRSSRKRASRIAGSATAATTRHSSRGSRPWACACTSPQPTGSGR